MFPSLSPICVSSQLLLAGSTARVMDLLGNTFLLLSSRGERGHSGLGVVRTNKLEYEDLLQKFQFLYEMCIRVYRIMGRKSRIVPQLGIKILKKKEF